ncbi:hypothetical protein [Nonomuraea zeae]|uniref:hypothetical protein n=1 Tax=Nonomuraea zeae TaxID=1642303 RepID=UPI00360B9E7A
MATPSLNGEWSITPEELAAIFRAKGWTFASERLGYGVPDAATIWVLLHAMAATCAQDTDEGTYTSFGRFLVMKPADFPHSYDVFLHVGFMWDDKSLAGAQP